MEHLCSQTQRCDGTFCFTVVTFYFTSLDACFHLHSHARLFLAHQPSLDELLLYMQALCRLPKRFLNSSPHFLWQKAQGGAGCAPPRQLGSLCNANSSRIRSPLLPA